MIDFNYLIELDLNEESDLASWIEFVLDEEGRELGEIAYIFCDDDYLLEINTKYLKHKTLTDIISFDYTLGKIVSGDIFISVDRIRENADINEVSFRDELHRVMIHGVLHYIGYPDKTPDEKKKMRSKEDYYLSLRTF